MWRRRAAQLAAASVRDALNAGRAAEGAGAAAAAALSAARHGRAAGEAAALARQARHQWGRPAPQYVVFQRPGRGYGGSGGQRNRFGITKAQQRLLVVVGAGGAVVWVSSRQEIPYTGRKHAILIDPESERQMGEQTFQAVLAEAAAMRTLLPPSHRATVLARRVGQRIAAVAGDDVGGGYTRHMQGLNWEFAVIDSKEVNAFVVPGGKVVIYTGLLRMVSTEDELAAVVAHEVAHVVARHAAERMTQGSVLELARMVAYWGFGLPIPSAPLAAVFFLPNSRKAETEADVIGVQLAARACFDPGAAVAVFTKLGAAEKAAGGDAIPKLLRTHPVSDDRITAIRQMLPKAEMLGEAAGCSTPVDLLQQFEAAVGSELGRPPGWGGW